MKKKVIIVIIVIVLIIVGIVIFRRIKNKKETESGSTSSGSSSSGSSTTSTFPLRHGSRGDNVKQLQASLNKLMSPIETQLVTDGIFGNKTLAALQYHTGLTQVTQTQLNKLLSLTSLVRGIATGYNALTTDEKNSIINA